MKIVHIINSLGSGGAERLLEEFIPIINNKEGRIVDVLLLTDKDNVFDKKLIKNNIKIHTLPLKQVKNPLNIFYIKKFIEDGKYDIVHAHLFPTLYWVSIASNFKFKNKPKFIYTEHSTHNKRRNIFILRNLEKKIYKSFDSIISISDSGYKNIIEWLRPKQKELEKFTVINNGINIDKFKKAKLYRKSDISDQFTDNTKLLCMGGRFSESKDQLTLIKSMLYIPEDIHLLLIGEGHLRDANEKLAKNLGVEERVHFLGFRSDIERIFISSDIIVQSSNWEGFGLTVVEGMAAGKPVLVSDIDTLKIIVKNEKLVFTKGNEKELAEKIKLLLNNKTYYKKYADFCSNRANNYNIKHMTNQILDLYKSLY